MHAETRRFVRERAGHRCEYCLLHQQHSEISHHVEHIVARQHGGSDELWNLALACHHCNLRKGPNLSGIDPLTGCMALLFHPRRDRWTDHFAMQDAHIQGLTATGRATIEVLAFNNARRLELRQELQK